jgi:magnesium-transporting ATPase (P-type)
VNYNTTNILQLLAELHTDANCGNKTLSDKVSENGTSHRLNQHGRNLIISVNKRSGWKVFLSNSKLVLLLIGASILSVFLDSYGDCTSPLTQTDWHFILMGAGAYLIILEFSKVIRQRLSTNQTIKIY